MGQRDALALEISQFFPLTVGLALAAMAAPKAPRHRAAHRVAVAEDVEAGGQATNVRMYPFEFGQDAFGPGFAWRFEQQAATFGWRNIMQGAVVGEDRAAQAAANQLVGGDDIAEAGTVVENVIPGGRGTVAFFGEVR